MSSSPTRRNFIAASLVAPAALPVIDVLAIDDLERFRLMRRRENLRSEIAKLDRKWVLAYAELPSWCRSGPKYRDQDGRMFGGIVGWPDAGSDAIELASGALLIRPSVRDIFELRIADRFVMAREDSERIFRVRLEKIVYRLRKRRWAEKEVELPRSSAWLLLETELEAIEIKIGASAV